MAGGAAASASASGSGGGGGSGVGAAPSTPSSKRFSFEVNPIESAVEDSGPEGEESESWSDEERDVPFVDQMRTKFGISKNDLVADFVYAPKSMARRIKTVVRTGRPAFESALQTASDIKAAEEQKLQKEADRLKMISEREQAKIQKNEGLFASQVRFEEEEKKRQEEEERRKKEEEEKKLAIQGVDDLISPDALRKLVLKKLIYCALRASDEAEEKLTMRGAFGLEDRPMLLSSPLDPFDQTHPFIWQPLLDEHRSIWDQNGRRIVEKVEKERRHDDDEKDDEPIPSRVVTSEYLINYLMEQYNPRVDTALTGFQALYSVLLTEFAVESEKSQSAPYPGYQDPVSKDSCLLICAQMGFLDVLELMNEMLPGLMDLNQVDRDGNSALYLAAQHGYYAVVKYLVEDMDHPYTRHPHTEWTPLMAAAAMGHWPVVHYFIHDWGSGKHKYQCKFHATTEAYYDILAHPYPSIYEVNDRGENALILAGNNGYLNIVRMLLEYSYDHPPNEEEEYYINGTEWIDHKNADDISALLSAMLYGQLFVVEYLISQNADRNIESTYRPPDADKFRDKETGAAGPGGDSKKGGSKSSSSSSQYNSTATGSSRRSKYSQYGSKSAYSRASQGSMGTSMNYSSYGGGGTHTSQRSGADSDSGSDSDDGAFSTFRRGSNNMSRMSRTHISDTSQMSRRSGNFSHDESQMTARSRADPSRNNQSMMSRRRGSARKKRFLESTFDAIRLYAAAEKKNGVTAEQIDNAVESGKALRKAVVKVPMFRNQEKAEQPPMPLPEHRKLLHAFFLDNLYDVYIQQAEQDNQLRSVVVLYQLHLRLFAEWAASTAEDLGVVKDLKCPELAIGKLRKDKNTIRRRLRDEHLEYLARLEIVPTDTVNGLFLDKHLTLACARLMQFRRRQFAIMRKLRLEEAGRNYRIACELLAKGKVVMDPVTHDTAMTSNLQETIERRCVVAKNFDPRPTEKIYDEVIKESQLAEQAQAKRENDRRDA